jgi:hypothetical protein
MTQGYFFGYGSLVNHATHGFAPVHKARARGWRRAWRALPERDLCYLTAVPAPGAEIEGLIAPVPPDGWATLDLREAAYLRRDASAQIDHGAEASEIAIYAIAEGRSRDPDAATPILLSYLDVVVQGYLQHFGEPGVARFFASTEGWQAPVLDDRAAPLYPRAQRLSAAETALVDAHLAQTGSPRLPAGRHPSPSSL